ncbi:hypothetical protein M0R45_025040 [Rubus argutus]|uniref:Uncharacterized protein n=1 Tax=Rubus argutus TaxID=59490 RepID=A0AAW1WUW8_RUBAR
MFLASSPPPTTKVGFLSFDIFMASSTTASHRVHFGDSGFSAFCDAVVPRRPSFRRLWKGSMAGRRQEGRMVWLVLFGEEEVVLGTS